MDFESKIRDVQKMLADRQLDGWLLYDFRRLNDLACQFLNIPPELLLTRRFFYWIPREGTPTKLVHHIEKHSLDHLPGETLEYTTWRQLENYLQSLLKGVESVAMEYSPRNAIPYLSKVDGGTVDLIRSFGPKVGSSADLLQQYTSVWTEEQLQSHLFATKVLSETVDKAWDKITDCFKNGREITEYTVQQWILECFRKKGCVTHDAPICAVNAHSADPHYSPTAENDTPIRQGDFILIDLWCKQDIPHAVYGDITRVGVAAAHPTTEQQQIFDIVKIARDTATDFIKACFASKKPVKGCEVDRCCRQVIEDAGYGEYFVHRTGHSIGQETHGDGANIDSFETEDERQLLPGTCFSIEPGIYLPGQFGVRLEYDVYIHQDGTIQVTGGIQAAIKTLAVT